MIYVYTTEFYPFATQPLVFSKTFSFIINHNLCEKRKEDLGERCKAPVIARQQVTEMYQTISLLIQKPIASTTIISSGSKYIASFLLGREIQERSFYKHRYSDRLKTLTYYKNNIVRNSHSDEMRKMYSSEIGRQLLLNNLQIRYSWTISPALRALGLR